MTLAELNDKLIKDLAAPLGAGEAKATARLLLEDDLQATPTQILIHGDRVLEPETVERFKSYVERITAGEPPQYVVGRARFMGMDLAVTPATLIPRPETAELVDIITDAAGGKADLRVLDIGTGSGCIAIALSRGLVFPKITAIDISEEALAVAERNARSLSARISFCREDILHPADDDASVYDIIVSNPPYIAQSERAEMESRVKDHEPASALFVPDADPLRFYRAIAQYAQQHLAADGAIYFEINPRYADELAAMLAKAGYECEIRLDSFGKKRFAIARRV